VFTLFAPETQSISSAKVEEMFSASLFNIAAMRNIDLHRRPFEEIVALNFFFG